MDYHQNARLTVHSRELLAKRVVEQELTLKQAAFRFNVSAKTAAKWVRRYREFGRAGLGDRSSRPRRCPRTTSSPLIERVLALRRLRYNGWRIAQTLALSRATVSRILRRAGMNRLRSLDPPPPVVRYEHPHPGDLIHFDIKRLARIVKPGHRIHGDRTRETRGAGYEYLHIAIDDHSRISFAAILPDQTHRLGPTLLPHDPRPLLALRLPDPPRAHRQRLLLQERNLPHDPPSAARQTPLHQTLHPAHQRQGRTFHPDRTQRMGLRTLLPEFRRAD
jgi:transposase